MASDNVVALPGNKVPHAIGEPVDEIVAILTSYLAQARAGQLVAVGIAGVMRDGSESEMTFQVNHAIAGQLWNLNIAIGQLRRAHDRMIDG